MVIKEEKKKNMTAEDITSTISATNGPIGGASANRGTGLVWGSYSITCTENDDFVILPEFTAIKFAVVVSDSTGAMTPAEVTIDETTTNKLVFTNGGSNDLHLLVFGTPSVETD